MSQKAEKPVLSGQRIKTRKRDEKEKYDPSSFRDTVIQGLNDSGGSLEQVSKFLDGAGGKLDYRRYAEPLFDILFAGGILAPGGTIQENADPTKPSRADVCIFAANQNMEVIKAYYDVFCKLIRRYKYLEKSFAEELEKLIVFLRGFGESERRTLAMMYGLFMATGLSTPDYLVLLFEEHLVRDGLALEFATIIFQTWLKEKQDFSSINSALRRCQMEGKLLNLLPSNKRTWENFENHFHKANLDDIVNYQKAQLNTEVKKEMLKTLASMIREEEPIKEIAIYVKEQMKKHSLPEHETVVQVWNTLMNCMEQSKKEELVAEQALKHLRLHSHLLVSLTTSARSQLALLVRIQEYCYDNQIFMKVFQKIVVLFYKSDILSEDVILKWYMDSHSAKGKSFFLEQMKKFVEWLQQAEEESEEDD